MYFVGKKMGCKIAVQIHPNPDEEEPPKPTPVHPAKRLERDESKEFFVPDYKNPLVK
jgi:hypothetical protein